MTSNRNPASREPGNPETWVADYGDYRFGFAVKRARDRSATEKLVQKTFLAALRRIFMLEANSPAGDGKDVALFGDARQRTQKRPANIINDAGSPVDRSVCPTEIRQQRLPAVQGGRCCVADVS